MKKCNAALLTGVLILLFLGVAFLLATQRDTTSPKALFERLELALDRRNAGLPEAERAILTKKPGAMNFRENHIESYILYKGYGDSIILKDGLCLGIDVVGKETRVDLNLAFGEKKDWSPEEGFRLFQSLSEEIAQICSLGPDQRRALAERVTAMIKGYAAGEKVAWSQEEMQMTRTGETPRWTCMSNTFVLTDSTQRWSFSTSITIGDKPKATFTQKWIPQWLLTWLRGGVTVEWLYPPTYSYTPFGRGDFSEGRVWVSEQDYGPWTLLDDKGNILKKDFEAFLIGQYENGIARFAVESERKSLTGFLDRSGDVVSPPQDYGILGGSYGDGLISKQDESGRFGFVDLDGKWVISPDYASVWFFREGRAAVIKEKSGKWGFIDKSGDVAIDFKFDLAFMFSHNMALVQVDSKYGVIDPQGNWIAEPTYENMVSYRWSNLIALEKDGKVGFIDSKGKVAIDFQFPSQSQSKNQWGGLYHFEDGYASVILKDFGGDKQEFGIIDETGKVVFKTGETPGRVWNGFLFDRDEEGIPALVDEKGNRHPFPPDFKYPPVQISPTKDGIFTYRDEKSQKMGYFTIDK